MKKEEEKKRDWKKWILKFLNFKVNSTIIIVTDKDDLTDILKRLQ